MGSTQIHPTHHSSAIGSDGVVGCSPHSGLHAVHPHSATKEVGGRSITFHEPAPKSGDESPHSRRCASSDGPGNGAKRLECVRFTGAFRFTAPAHGRQADGTSHEPSPERGLQSAGTRAGLETSLRAGARVPQPFITTEHVRRVRPPPGNRDGRVTPHGLSTPGVGECSDRVVKLALTFATSRFPAITCRANVTCRRALHGCGDSSTDALFAAMARIGNVPHD